MADYFFRYDIIKKYDSGLNSHRYLSCGISIAPLYVDVLMRYVIVEKDILNVSSLGLFRC